ncbi:hypothetical protein F2P79_007803 [Pimephales promelas]|nr:hypothetical protein F2P79_007803 [Pimephales promelas]
MHLIGGSRVTCLKPREAVAMVTSVRLAPPLPLIFLLMIHGVCSQKEDVIYSPTHICAVKDSTVIMNCTYTYPTGYKIEKVFWTKGPLEMDLSNDPEYRQRLQYLGDKQQDCTVRLSHVTLKDSHMYYFRFITDKEKWIGKPGVTLNVTDLQVESPERVTEGDSVSLTCKSSCALTDRATFIWYRNSLKILTENAPRNVSISPSGEIVEGDSVTLKCISDSNPPALNFRWFKENESSAVGSGQSFSALQSGRFYCQAHNQHGSQRSDAVTVTVKVLGSLLILYTSIGVICGAAVIIMMLIWGSRWMKKRNDTQMNHPRPDHERRNAYDVELSDPVYENVTAFRLDDCEPELDSSLYENLPVIRGQECGPTETFSAGAYGIRSRGNAARIASYKTASAVASRSSPEVGMASRYAQSSSNSDLPSNLLPMDEPQLLADRCPSAMHLPRVGEPCAMVMQPRVPGQDPSALCISIASSCWQYALPCTAFERCSGVTMY